MGIFPRFGKSFRWFYFWFLLNTCLHRKVLLGCIVSDSHTSGSVSSTGFLDVKAGIKTGTWEWVWKWAGGAWKRVRNAKGVMGRRNKLARLGTRTGDKAAWGFHPDLKLEPFYEHNELHHRKVLLVKQSKNSMLKTRIYVIGCFVNFLVIFGYIWVEN